MLRLWEGLGYYRRARQLHRAARIIVSEHGSRFPRDPPVVRRLPGIGRYTAGAILSIAFGLPEPILEANTLRLLSRLLAYKGDPRSADGQRRLWAMAGAVLPRRDPGRFNQALMELGSEICGARNPRCEMCPMAMLCRANQQGRQFEIPRPRVRQPIEAVREAAVVVRRGGQVLLVRRPDGGRWAGLWDFPRFSLRGQTPAAIRRELVENVHAMAGATITIWKHLVTLTHSVTRFRITLECYAAKHVASGDGAAVRLETRWLPPAELAKYPLSSTGRKLAKLLLKNSPQRTRRMERRKK